MQRTKGTILIVTLWVLVILTVFAVALGQRASWEIKLAEYQRDQLRAAELAKAAINRAIWEKKNNDVIENADALGEPWANNQAIFKDFELGDENFTGSGTVSYSLDGDVFYGMEDEQSKINVNQAGADILEKLLELCNAEEPETLAHSILVWCGKILDEEEEGEYEHLPYDCKAGPAQSIAELLLVRGMTEGVLYGEDQDADGVISEEEEGIAAYLTVYGEGKVNINTAAQKVLMAITNDWDLVDKIVLYRKGLDAESSDDDNWFELVGEDFKASDMSFFEQFFVSSAEAQAKLDSLKNFNFSVTSDIYTIHARAEVSKVKKNISATIELDRQNPEKLDFLAWYRN